ncbi:MAG: hypothetical protein K2H48_06470 [Duncaniella sp.]|nr:hypothetical protein [Duncaniella sp.]
MSTIISKFKRIAVSVMAIGALTATASAQNLNSGYFTDGYLYRYQLNPSFDNDKTFFTIPALGTINLGLQGTVGVENFLYNVNGRTTTFLNPAVDAGSFLDDLGSRSRITSDIRLNILACGFKAFKGYNVVTLGVRTNLNVGLPRELFRMFKEGITNDTYDITDVHANATAWAELAFNHSHKINDQWQVGGALKFLLGGGNISANLRSADLTLGRDSWNAVTDADIHASVKGFKYDTDINEHTGHRYVSGADVDGTGLNGFGMSVDLGGTYKFNKDWTFSASLLDFGFISWNNDVLASTDGLQSFSTDKYTFNVDGDATNSFDNEFDKIRDDISAIYELNDKGDQGGRTTMLGATLNLAAEYTFPYYRNLTFGALSSTRIHGEYTWTDFRISANVAPVKVFSAGANVAVGTFGWSFGWILNLHCPGFSLFLATDHTPGRLAKQGVPLSTDANFAMGMNVQF